MAGALVLLICTSPVLLVVAIMARLLLGSPILFRQERTGKGGRSFELLKLRSMLPPTDRREEPLSDAARLTRFGRMLRATSIDELPSLLNILRGDMSLVGPRPLLPEYLPLYSAEQRRRLEVLPGLTGWAQVNGRNAIGWDEKFRLDIWYVDHRSLRLDLRILLLTAQRVVQRSGIDHDERTPMPRFTGSQP